MILHTIWLRYDTIWFYTQQLAKVFEHLEEYLRYVKCPEILTMQHTRHDHIDPVWNETKDNVQKQNMITSMKIFKYLSVYFYNIIIIADYRYIDYYL